MQSQRLHDHNALGFAAGVVAALLFLSSFLASNLVASTCPPPSSHKDADDGLRVAAVDRWEWDASQWRRPTQHKASLG